jgi:DNA-binding NtrC family response regulator
MRYFFAWIGNADLNAANEKDRPGSGPIAQVLLETNFDKVILLSNYGERKNKLFAKWVKSSTSATLESHNTLLTSPTSFNEIYEFAVKIIHSSLKKENGSIELTFHLSPGTPAMASVWIILAKTRFPAELVECSKESGVKTVSFPFDISADYIPDLLRKPDEELIRLSGGLTEEAPEFKDIIHRSAQMKRIIVKARKIAPRNIPVLIQGESGTGKELFARAIHNSSPYKNSGEFVAVNCGALPAELVESELFGHERGAFTGAIQARVGYVEKAAGGTLFLDEIGDLPLYAQVKLLRVIQEKEVVRMGSTTTRKVNIRIISATNKNLMEEVLNGNFREDLFYRLGVGILNIPPLRSREGDIGLLVDKLFNKINDELARQPGHVIKKLSAAAKSTLMNHKWPGNIRELLNTLQAAIVFSPLSTIEKRDVVEHIHLFPKEETRDILGRPLKEIKSLQGIIDEVAQHYISKALKETGGHKAKTAKLLGLPSHQTLTNWMARCGLG